MLNCVDEPSSLGVPMPSVSEYAATGPVPPSLPQLPQVSQGDSSTRSSTVALGDVPGVGEGEGDGVAAGVGAGEALACVEDAEFPPHEASASVRARVGQQY